MGVVLPCRFQLKKGNQVYFKLIIIVPAMQPSQQAQPVLLFTIRFHNHRPQLAPAPALTHSSSANSLPTIPHNPTHSLTHPPVLITTTPHLPLLHSHTQKELALPTTLAKVASEPVKQAASMLAQQQKATQNIQLSHSLIDELLLIGEQDHCLTNPRKTGLEDLDILETESIRDQDDDDDLQDQHSQIVAMTEEQKNFFTNFIVHQPVLSLEDSMFKNVHIVDTHSRVVLKSSRILRQRKKLIRNFFRPKSSFLKQQQTSCNSSSNLQQFADPRKSSLPLTRGACSRSQLPHLINQ